MTSPASFHAKSAREVSSVGVVSSQIAASVGTYDVDTRTAGKAQAPPDSRQPAYGFVDFAVLDDSHCFLPQHSRPRRSASGLRARQRTEQPIVPPRGLQPSNLIAR